jgi:hypothetical protein
VIEYSIDKIINQERGTADLVVRARDAVGAILIASAVVFNAPPDAEFDLTIPVGRQEPPSLFDQLTWASRPWSAMWPSRNWKRGRGRRTSASSRVKPASTRAC